MVYIAQQEVIVASNGGGILGPVAGTHLVFYGVRSQPVGVDGFALEEYFKIDGGAMFGIATHTYTREGFYNAFEVAHHVLHGRPPQGLDPREGPTRIHPGPGR